MAGVVILVVVFGAAVFAPAIAPRRPTDAQLIDRLKPPGSRDTAGRVYYLGTDSLGRDELSRLLFGARISLLVGVSAVVIGGVLGVALGVCAGYYGRWADDLIMRLGDIQLAFPSILLYIAVLAVLGPGLLKVIAILGVTGWATFGRVTRAQVLAVRELEFVGAARAAGCGDARTIARHILPNILAPIIVLGSFAVAANIIAESSLSFLGLGVPPAIPSWGTMLSDSQQYLQDAWWPAALPGLAITLTVLAINAVGDWLRDYLDPALRE